MGRHRKTNSEALRLASTAEPSQADPDAPLPDLGPLKPTPVYNTYWRFAAERQAVFFRRFERRPPPWTHDPVLRAQVHQRLPGVRPRQPVPDPPRDLPHGPAGRSRGGRLPHRCCLSCSTRSRPGSCWRRISARSPTRSIRFKRYDQVLSRAMARGRRSTRPLTSCRPAAPSGTSGSTATT